MCTGIALTALVLNSCSGELSGWVVNKSVLMCADHGGIIVIKFGTTNTTSVICADGTWRFVTKDFLPTPKEEQHGTSKK